MEDEVVAMGLDDRLALHDALALGDVREIGHGKRKVAQRRVRRNAEVGNNHVHHLRSTRPLSAVTHRETFAAKAVAVFTVRVVVGVDVHTQPVGTASVQVAWSLYTRRALHAVVCGADGRHWRGGFRTKRDLRGAGRRRERAGRGACLSAVKGGARIRVDKASAGAGETPPWSFCIHVCVCVGTRLSGLTMKQALGSPGVLNSADTPTAVVEVGEERESGEGGGGVRAGGASEQAQLSPRRVRAMVVE